MNYILNEQGEPELCEDIIAWCKWFGTVDRHVGDDHIGDVHVSTVFLASDHDFTMQGPPVLWETMIFGGEHDQYCDRYTSRADAEAGHAAALRMVSP